MSDLNPGKPLDGAFELRRPVLEDGMSVFRLISRCPPLDENSSYCNFLQCSHFSQTSVCALMHADLVGFISGYRVPGRDDTLFIWQVAVDARARGSGLARQMLMHILNRPESNAVRYLETTITPANKASWALFEGLARRLSAPIDSSTWLDQQAHFDGQHDSEELVRIGPFNLQQIAMQGKHR